MSTILPPERWLWTELASLLDPQQYADLRQRYVSHRRAYAAAKQNEADYARLQRLERQLASANEARRRTLQHSIDLVRNRIERRNGGAQ